MPTVVVTALIGGTLSAVTEYLSQKAEGRKKISWKDVVISAAGGAISASVPFLAEKKVCRVVAEVAADAAVGSISYVAQNKKIGSGMVLAGVESMVTGQLVGGISKKLRIKEPDKEILTIKKIEQNEKNRIRNKISKRKAVDRYRKKAKLKKKPLKTRIKRFFSARKRLKSVKKGLKRVRRVVYSTLVKNSIVSGIYNAAKRTVGRYKTSIKKTVHHWAGSIRRKFRRWWK